MTGRLILLPTQTTQGIFNHHPHLSKLALVAILFSNTLQAVSIVEGKTLHLHNKLKTGEISPSQTPLT